MSTHLDPQTLAEKIAKAEAERDRRTAEATELGRETSAWLEDMVAMTPCPFCGAGPNAVCRTRTQRKTVTHGARWQACPEWAGYRRGLHLQWSYQAVERANRELSALRRSA